jgi:hypothetical protein
MSNSGVTQNEAAPEGRSNTTSGKDEWTDIPKAGPSAPEDEVRAPSLAARPRGRPFAKGTSGNPNGRPRGARNKATLAAEALLEGEAEALTRKLVDKAKEGNISALRFCLDRICPPRRDRVVTIEMPEIGSLQDAGKAATTIFAACAAGEISTGEAADLLALLTTLLRLLEGGEFEARLEAVEDAAGVSP